MTDYKQLSKELYEALKQANTYIANYDANDRVFTILQKYEQETTRSTGRTTALYIKCIAEALENPGKSVEFIDHYPHNWMLAESHVRNLRNIIEKLGYNIVVQTKGQAQVFLYNKFGL